MIFTGDLVFPEDFQPDCLDKTTDDFWHLPKIVNLESAIDIEGNLSDNLDKKTKGIALKSNKDIIHFLKQLNIQAVSLANNHMFDYKIDIDEKIKFLRNENIATIGAGKHLLNAATPYYNEAENIVVTSFGWNVIRCQYAKKNKPGVNPYEYRWVENNIRMLRSTYKDALLVVAFHWNYEFERYPQPADRAFAHHLIDLGVDAIVGHHAHIIQGYEYYYGKPIFYGLGNFYFPNGDYAGFSLNFPTSTHQGLAVNISKNKVEAYLTVLKDNRVLSLKESGSPEDIGDLSEISTFQNMTHKEYLDFFAFNRHKRNMLPIYKSFQSSFKNAMKDYFVQARQIPVDLLGKLKGGH